MPDYGDDSGFQYGVEDDNSVFGDIYGGVQDFFY